MGNKKDPNMKNPMPKYILLIVLALIIAFILAPKIIDIYNDNVNDTSQRAEDS